MRPPLIDMVLSQILFWGNTIFFFSISRLFYLSEDGRIRVLAIRLFGALTWLFLIAGIYYFLWDIKVIEGDYSIYVRLICNVPLIFIAIQWYRHVKWGK